MRSPARLAGPCLCVAAAAKLLSGSVLRDACSAVWSAAWPLRAAAAASAPSGRRGTAVSPMLQAQQQEHAAVAAAAMVLSQEVSVSLSIIALVSLVGAGVGVGSGIGAWAATVELDICCLPGLCAEVGCQQPCAG